MLKPIVLEGLMMYLASNKQDFTYIEYPAYPSDSEYIEIDREALQKLINEYFSSGHGNT